MHSSEMRVSLQMPNGMNDRMEYEGGIERNKLGNFGFRQRLAFVNIRQKFRPKEQQKSQVTARLLLLFAMTFFVDL